MRVVIAQRWRAKSIGHNKPMLGECWPTGFDGGPTLVQCIVSAGEHCWGTVDKD